MSTMAGAGSMFQGVVIAHAAVHGGMMANFGRHFAARLVEEGAELHFFASRLEVFGRKPPVEDLKAIGGQFHGLPVSERLSPLRMMWSFLLMVVSLRRLHVQIIHTRSSIMGVIGRLAAKAAGVPIIIHHQDDLYSRDGRLTPRFRRLVALIEQKLSLLADRSLFVSDAVLEDATALGFLLNRCVVVRNDVNEFFEEAARRPEKREPAETLLRALGVPEGARIVGCIGRLVPHKGIDLFLDAVEQLAPNHPNWVFVIKGDGPLRDSLQARIRAKELSGRVFLFTAEMPREDVPTLYQCFDLFTLPTRREGFGLVFAEAMVMGVPVVGPRMAPVSEVVPEDCGVLVEPDDSAALADALGTVMTDDALRERLGAKGRRYAVDAYCHRRAAGRVMDVYRDLLGELRARD